jgi:hypothetical protein
MSSQAGPVGGLPNVAGGGLRRPSHTVLDIETTELLDASVGNLGPRVGRGG